jgi:hypothetical protein
MLMSLAVVIATLIGLIPGVRRQYHEDRAGFWQTMRLFALYLAYIVAGIGILLVLLRDPQTPVEAVAAGFFMLAWIINGSVWLTRLAPRYRELPALIDRFPSRVDYGSWIVMAAGLATSLIA